jgi:hypothetical protein
MTALKPRDLFALAMKLLNLPADAAALFHNIRVVLSQVIGNDVIRALVKEH